MGRLTVDQVQRIRQLRADGVSVATIAAEFGLTTAGVYYHTSHQPTRKSQAKAAQPTKAAKPKAPKHVVPKAPKAPKSPHRWRVERDRSEDVLANGWVAYDGHGNGAHFPTWPEAWRFALAQALRAQTERVSKLELAFPWSAVLPLDDRTLFAEELANHPKGSTERDIEQMIAGWRSSAAEYANRGLMKARGRAS